MKLAVVAVIAVECVTSTEPGPPLTTGDLVEFVELAQPALMSCANASCHGDPGRPLALYAPLLRRADPSDLWLDEPLTDAECLANLEASLSFVDLVQAERSLLVRKPLAPSEGGSDHSGGVQWWSADDSDHEAVVEWIRSVQEGQ